MRVGHHFLEMVRSLSEPVVIQGATLNHGSPTQMDDTLDKGELYGGNGKGIC